MHTIKYPVMAGLAFVVVPFLTIASTGLANAQDSKPLRLAPALKKAPPPDLERPAPRRTSGDIANPRVPTISSRVSGGAVQIDNLKAINAEEAGTLTAETGALGPHMWTGTSRDLIERLLGKLPIHASSAAMRTLMRKLLLSPARLPEGGPHNVGLIKTRLQALITMGALEEADQLIEILPVARASELIALEADLRFLANDNARACALAELEMVNKPTPYWQKAFTFCQIIKGEKQKAELSLLLMRELGEPDEAFLQIAEGLVSGVPAALTSLDNPTPLHLAMARAGQVELPGDVMNANTPSVLRAISMSPKASIGLRLEAAERADVAGALPIDALRQLYASVNFSPEDLANPLSRAEVEFGPMVRALLYHTSLVQTVPTAQAEATARAFALARDEGRYASTVHVFQPVLRRIPPSNQLLWFAPEAVRALLLAGDRERAQAWYQVLLAGANFNEDAAKAIHRFRPLAHLFDFPVSDDADQSITAAWWEASRDQPDAASKAVLLFTILDALDVAVGEADWEPLISWQPRVQQTVPDVGLLTRLRSLTKKAQQAARENSDNADSERAIPVVRDLTASDPSQQPNQLFSLIAAEPRVQRAPEHQRIGETVLLSLLAVGDAGPAKADVMALGDVLRALSAVGLKEEAQALALEAALANDL